MSPKIQFERDPLGLNQDPPQCPCPICTARRMLAAKLSVPIEALGGPLLFVHSEPQGQNAPELEAVEPGYFERQQQIAAAEPPRPRGNWFQRFMRWLIGATQGDGVRRDG